MVKYADYDHVWLVKSAGLVLGPFSFIELTKALRERHVAILDEIRSPTSRWGFVREHPQLSEIVKLVRESDSRQSGKTSLTITDREDQQNLTESISEDMPEDMTPLPGDKSRDEYPQMDGNSSQKKSIPGRPNIFMVPKPLGPPGSLPGTSDKRWSVFAWIAVVVILIGGGSWTYLNQRKTTAAISHNELLELARRNKSLGFYEKSLAFYQRVAGANPVDDNLKLEMLPLMVQDATQIEKALQYGRDLESSANLTPENLGKVENWIAEGIMKQGLFAAADEQLKKAWESKQNQKNIGVNRVINKFLLGRWDETVSLAQELKTSGNEHPLISITESLAVLNSPRESSLTSMIPVLVDELQTAVQRHRDLTMESLLLIAALQERAGWSNFALQSMDRLLNKTAGISHSYIHDLDVDFEVVGWSRLAPVCDRLTLRFGSLVQGVALAVFCKIEQGEWSQAESLLAKAGIKFLGDSRMVDLNAEILRQHGKNREAAQVLESSSTRVADLLNAQLCLEEKSMECFEAKIRPVLEVDPNDPEALLEMAKYYLIRNKRDLAEQELEKGLAETANFRPLLEFREELGGF